MGNSVAPDVLPNPTEPEYPSGMGNKSLWRTIFSIVLVVAITAAIISECTNRQTNHLPSPGETTQQNSGHYPGATAPELTSAQCHMQGVLPDSTFTPGVVNPAVTQANINQTICVSGYTKAIRPSVTYTNKLKLTQMAEYGFTDSIRSHEEDHLISLELGGAPSDPKNLWPEPHASPNAKDSVENVLHTALCAGRISLQDAQHRIATNWTTAAQGL
jgi:hypothetical protein